MSYKTNRGALERAILAFIIHYVAAAPIANGTISIHTSEPAYQPEPAGRGTISIIGSSIITLTLCVWTALHMNVYPNATTPQRLLKKTQLVFLGMLAPEAVLILALAQLRQARKFHREFCDALQITRGSKDDILGMTGAFFVCMGGYCVHRTERGSIFATTLTTNGFLRLMKEKKITQQDIDKTLIRDMGKADILAKSLVCVQAFWMVVQCAVRATSGLPVPLLELHVVMHVLCTIITYAFWWNKPQDVNCPIAIVRDTGVASLMSLFSLKNRLDISLDSDATLPTSTPDKIDYAADADPDSETPIDDGSWQERSQVLSVLTGSSLGPLPDYVEKVHFLSSDSITIDTVFGGSREVGVEQYKESLLQASSNTEVMICGTESLLIGNQIKLSPGRESHIILQRGDLETLQSAAAAVIRLGRNNLAEYEHPHHRSDSWERTKNQSVKWFCGDRKTKYQSSELLSGDRETKEQSPEWFSSNRKRLSRLLGFSSEGPRKDNSLQVLMLDLIYVWLPLVYGTCHLAAWSTHFPTEIEGLLWRIAATVVGVIPALIAVGTLLSRHGIFDRLFGGWSVYMSVNWDEWYGKVCIFMVVAVVFCSRAYLLVESFISLRSLPIGSFESTPWEDYWPHF